MNQKYELIDSGEGLKLERFADLVVQRPCQQAIWPKKLKSWDNKADLIFSRDGGNHWQSNKKVPKNWQIDFAGLKLQVGPTDFGHMGVFPEHQVHYEWMSQFIQKQEKFKFLNLFAYSGAASLYMAKASAHVCHVDASKKIVDYARENAKLSHLEDKPIRWIVDDAIKFIKREAARGSHYHGILLDPPSFGRGAQGQVFKIEEMLFELLELCKNILDKDANFLLLTNHTPGLTGLVLENCIKALNLPKGHIDSGEMIIPSEKGFSIPSGTYARWAK